MQLVFDLFPQRRAAQSFLDALVHVALEAVQLQAVSNVFVDAHREGVRLLEHHADTPSHGYRIDLGSVDVTALVADGPQNVLDAVAVARHAGARGVVAVCAGTIHAARDVQKVHPYQLDAFSSGDAGPLGYVEEGRLRLLRSWPEVDENRAPDTLKTITALGGEADWPHVEIVMSHAGASGAVVEAMFAGLPVLASDIPVNKEVITHLQTGYLFNKGSVQDITRALLWYKDNISTANEMATNAHQHAMQNFELGMIAGKLENYLLNMIIETN